MLLPAKTGYQLCDGVMLTGTGLVDGKLHIQVKYDDILNTDNHGYAYLKSSSGEIINYSYSVAFWADNKADSYEVDQNTHNTVVTNIKFGFNNDEMQALAAMVPFHRGMSYT